MDRSHIRTVVDAANYREDSQRTVKAADCLVYQVVGWTEWPSSAAVTVIHFTRPMHGITSYLGWHPQCGNWKQSSHAKGVVFLCMAAERKR